MSTMRLEWGGELQAMADRIRNIRDNLIRAAREVADSFAGRIQSAAQDGAPWTDRTSNARQGLSTKADVTESLIKIVLFHTASYGIWLEVRWGGRYAIIMRTLQEWFPQLMSALAALVR